MLQILRIDSLFSLPVLLNRARISRDNLMKFASIVTHSDVWINIFRPTSFENYFIVLFIDKRPYLVGTYYKRDARQNVMLDKNVVFQNYKVA